MPCVSSGYAWRMCSHVGRSWTHSILVAMCHFYLERPHARIPRGSLFLSRKGQRPHLSAMVVLSFFSSFFSGPLAATWPCAFGLAELLPDQLDVLSSVLCLSLRSPWASHCLTLRNQSGLLGLSVPRGSRSPPPLSVHHVLTCWSLTHSVACGSLVLPVQA